MKVSVKRPDSFIPLRLTRSNRNRTSRLSSYCVRKISPLQNNMVIFTTDEKSFHGHPHPLKSPEVVWRNSLALYYYSSKKPSTNFLFSRTYTDYRPIRGDTFRRYSLIRSFFSPINIFRKIYRIVFR